MNLLISVFFCYFLTKKRLYKAIFLKSCDDFNLNKSILPQKQDSDSYFSKKRANWTIKSLFLGLLSVKLFFALILLLTFPSLADAGITSFFSEIFYDNDVKQEILTETNSQNMPLLQSVPNSDPNPAKGGGDITIVEDEALLSETGPSGTIADIQEGNSDGMVSVYVVQKGDNLSSIAEMFNVSVNTIMWANDIKPGAYLKVGQTLTILPISGVKYTVKQGDILKNIVAKYKGDLEEVVQYNNIKEDLALVIGDTLIIPNGRMEQITNIATKSKTKGTNGQYYEGYYIRPIEGGTKSQKLHGWNAVDLAASNWTPIFAAASGIVTVSKNYGWNGGYGNYAVIEHPNKTQTVYGHMIQNSVREGEYVTQGQVIGFVGSTGRSTGPHLHFEIRGAKNPF